MSNTSAAVIVAAGASRRMQGRDKLWLPLAGRIALARTIDVFEASACIDRIILVLNAEHLVDAAILCQQESWHKIVAIVPGGMRRQESACAGLDALAGYVPSSRWVTIHDGARPLLTPTMLEAGLAAAQEHGAAIAAVPVTDTIKQVHLGTIGATLDRAHLWNIQTPQVFAFPLIHQAHHSPAAQQEAADDASLLERLGQPITIFPGAYTNIKITTQEDLFLAETFLQGLHT